MAAEGQVNGMKSDNDIVFGLMSSQGKYLTAEKFGNQISATGLSLRQKQMWVFVQSPEGGSKGYLRSPQNVYLETNKHGDVKCESEEMDSSFVFDVSVSDDGKWTFRDMFGKYFSGNSERLYTTADQKPNAESYWAIHLAAHPQVNMKSVSRKRYVHHHEEELRCNVDIPWGHEAVMTLEFTNGMYSIRCSGGILNGLTGEISDTRTDDCMFVLAIRDNSFAFRATNGKYLTVYGPTGKLIATKASVGKDELFLLEQSAAQCVLVASNDKKVSHRQGIDLTANQMMEAENTETFQIGYHEGDRNKVTFQARDNKYWKSTGKGINVNAPNPTPECFFQMEWIGNKIALKSNNDKYLKITSGGTVQPVADSTSDPTALYQLELANRHILVLRCEHGYIGMQSGGNKIICNRGTHDTMDVEYEDGYYKLKAGNGKYWSVGNDEILQMSPDATLFVFELWGQSKMMIRAKDGQCLVGDHNGTIKANGDNEKSTIWEY